MLMYSAYVLPQCLLSPTAFGMSTSYISFYEEQGVGLNWSNMAESPLYNDNFNFVVCCTFMAFDAIVYLLLALYLDQVLPGENVFGLTLVFLQLLN